MRSPAAWSRSVRSPVPAWPPPPLSCGPRSCRRPRRQPGGSDRVAAAGLEPVGGGRCGRSPTPAVRARAATAAAPPTTARSSSRRTPAPACRSTRSRPTPGARKRLARGARAGRRALPALPGQRPLRLLLLQRHRPGAHLRLGARARTAWARRPGRRSSAPARPATPTASTLTADIAQATKDGVFTPGPQETAAGLHPGHGRPGRRPRRRRRDRAAGRATPARWRPAGTAAPSGATTGRPSRRRPARPGRHALRLPVPQGRRVPRSPPPTAPCRWCAATTPTAGSTAAASPTPTRRSSAAATPATARTSPARSATPTRSPGPSPPGPAPTASPATP